MTDSPVQRQDTVRSSFTSKIAYTQIWNIVFAMSLPNPFCIFFYNLSFRYKILVYRHRRHLPIPCHLLYKVSGGWRQSFFVYLLIICFFINFLFIYHSSTLTLGKQNNRLHVNRSREQIHRLAFCHLIAQVGQAFDVPGQGGGVAGDVDDALRGHGG